MVLERKANMATRIKELKNKIESKQPKKKKV